MSSNTSTRQNSIHSIAKNEKDSDANSTTSQKQEFASAFKRRLQDVRKKWGPLMAAKTHLDDEYTFPPGRYAGQGI